MEELGLDAPTAVVGSTDKQVKQMLRAVYRASQIARDSVSWPKLQREHTFDLVDSQANYSLPTDFDRFIFETEWDRDDQWPLIGPISPQEWQTRKSGVVTSAPHRMFRVKDRTDSVLYIHPTPSSGDAGQSLYFEYISKTWILPTTWTATTSFSAASYCSYNGNIYSTTAGGTTGSTAPTHTTGSASDGGVTWVFLTTAYTAFVADTDTTIIPEDLLTLGAMWVFLRAKGLPYEALRGDWQQQLKLTHIKNRGAKTLHIGGKNKRWRFVGPWNVADTGYGS